MQITVQDDRFYIMCPFLKNKLEDGKATQDRHPSHIFMFGPDWKIIDTFETGRFFCHEFGDYWSVKFTFQMQQTQFVN
jgi:hypothetical protein